MEAEFEDFEKNNKWNHIYHKIREASMKNNYVCKEAKKNENKVLNRYKDVIPYDHSRVELERSENKYINASLIKVQEADRAYILTQGPLANTTGHFWLMIWEQKTKAVLMLNRLIENGRIKCHLYWPNGRDNDDTDELILTDVNLKVQFLSENKQQHFVQRNFLLTDLESDESREIFHFHYTSWPDFGLPESPASFLQFLLAVRQSGALDPDSGPAIIHCSAGIGRSGTFALVDSCLVMIEKYGSVDAVNVIDVLLDMRNYRMGLIQTPEQLRFSYQAIIEGSKLLILVDNRNVPSNANNNTAEFIHPNLKIKRSMGINEADEADDFFGEYSDVVNDAELCSTLPPLPTKFRRSHSNNSQSSPEPDADNRTSVPNEMISSLDDNAFTEKPTSNSKETEDNRSSGPDSAFELRQRMRDEKRRKTEETIRRMKRKQQEAESRSRSRKKKSRKTFK